MYSFYSENNFLIYLPFLGVACVRGREIFIFLFVESYISASFLF